MVHTLTLWYATEAQHHPHPESHFKRPQFPGQDPCIQPVSRVQSSSRQYQGIRWVVTSIQDAVISLYITQGAEVVEGLGMRVEAHKYGIQHLTTTNPPHLHVYSPPPATMSRHTRMMREVPSFNPSCSSFGPVLGQAGPHLIRQQAFHYRHRLFNADLDLQDTSLKP